MEPDSREEELEALACIYPEMCREEDDPYAFRLEIPVDPEEPVQVRFSAGAPGAASSAPSANDLHQLRYLPAVVISCTLPEGYPSREPPVVDVSSSPDWLPQHTVQRLRRDAERVWEENAGQPMLFDYISQIHESAQGDVFGLAKGDGRVLDIDPALKLGILDFDKTAQRAAFDRGSYECGVCLEPKKGAVCYRLRRCGHVFCIKCLQDFYNHAITEGRIETVRCPAFQCAKNSVDEEGNRIPEQKLLLRPGELLQIPLEHDVVLRYARLKYKRELEADKTNVYCPRTWCGGVARTKRHPCPPDMRDVRAAVGQGPGDTSVLERDDSTLAETAAAAAAAAAEGSEEDLLCVCVECAYAFCRRCRQTWHGATNVDRCFSADDLAWIASRQERATLKYLSEFTAGCPTCGAPCQKTGGCNHMTCQRCSTHFCYLCQKMLPSDNPYQHYNETLRGKRTSCYQRLWELENGDGPESADYEAQVSESDDDDDGAGRPGGNDPAARLAHARREQLRRLGTPGFRPRRPRGGPNSPAVDFNVERESALVIRLAGIPGTAQPGQPPAPQPVIAAVPIGQHQPGGRGGAGGGGGRGGVFARGRRPGRRVPRRDVAGAEGGPEGEEMDEHMQAWVREFVALALADNEDQMDEPPQRRR